MTDVYGSLKNCYIKQVLYDGDIELLGVSTKACEQPRLVKLVERWSRTE